MIVDIEAEIRVAVQQNAIPGSAEPLLAALKQSDERLARHAEPKFERVRRAIARDIEPDSRRRRRRRVEPGDQARRGGAHPSTGGNEPSDNRIALMAISGRESNTLMARISSIAQSVSIMIE